MDDAVACWDISRCDRGTIDHDRGSNGERQRVSIDGSRRHAVRDVGGWDLTIEHVVQQDIRKVAFAFGRVKGGKVDTCVRKGLIIGEDQNGPSPCNVSSTSCLEQRSQPVSCGCPHIQPSGGISLGVSVGISTLSIT